MTVASLAPIDVDAFDQMVQAAMTEADPLVADSTDEDALALARATMRRGTIGAEPMAHQPNNQFGFFRVASNGVVGGRIPNRESSPGVPAWVAGTTHRPSLCADVEVEDIDCAGCGSGLPLVNYTFQANVANQESKAFDFALRDLNDLGTCPLPPDALRMKLGIIFGKQLWKMVQAAGLPTPPAATLAYDPAWGMAQLEYDAGFVGNGTLLMPSLLTAYMLDKKAVSWVNGDLRTASGNRVLTEGIDIAGTTPGVMKMALVGPIDYARTLIRTDTEPGRDRGNGTATAHRGFGLVRSDLCAAKEINVTVPPGCSVPV